MAESVNKQLMLLKGFAFDGDTGRTISDLYQALDAMGLTQDTPFVSPSWIEGDERPVGLNSYLDPEGKRVHIIWHSDNSGLSSVIDVVLNAPSLAKEKPEDESCNACGANMMEVMKQLAEEEMG